MGNGPFYDELPIFALAQCWKRYWASCVLPFVCGRVADVGAGIGNNTEYLINDRVSNWVFVEPDHGRINELKKSVSAQSKGIDYEIFNGTLSETDNKCRFDTILYIDVLEHITDDVNEVVIASERLAPGGHLVVLCPAYNWLYSPFDEAIGHERRYTKNELLILQPNSLKVVHMSYLDSVGVLASAVNRLLLRAAMPTAKQILFWDRFIVPISRIIDPCIRNTIGKSVLVVWKKS